MRKVFVCLSLLFALSTHAQTLYFPPKTSNTWDTIAPSRLGWCSDRIDSLYNYLQNTNTDAFIVLKDGKIVLEKYFGTFTQDSIHYWASAGKSLTATMVGIAKQKGLVNLDDSVSKYLGVGWSSEPPAKERLITVKHLLSMTSGLDDNPTFPCDNEDYNKACLQYKADAGTRWAYHTGAYKQLEEIVSVASGKTYNAATNEWIEAYTGMNGFWINSGVYFSNARDMARFGLLSLNKGIWQSDTVLRDTAYYRSMVNTSQNFNPSYGYLWWLNGKSAVMYPGSQLVVPTKLIPNAPNDMYCALGKNDQKIYVVPSKNMVIVRVGESAYGALALSPYDTLIWRYINKLDACTTTSVKEQKLIIPDLKIFPNPANNFISFSGLSASGNIRYSITNIYGQLVTQDETYNHSINISDLSSGTYFLSIESEDKYAVKQFIKN